MPKKQKIYILDDGTKANADLVAARVGLSKNAAYGRLRFSTDPEIVFAKKGEAVGHLYTVKKNKPTLGAPINQSKRRLIEYIVETKPFYADPLYRSMLKIINTTPRSAA